MERSRMGLIDKGRQRIPYSEEFEIVSIEARVSAAERKVDEILEKRATVQNAPGNIIDRNHAEIMTVLARLENSFRNEILRRLTCVESKLQSVA
jgi:hypothetical protein